MVWSKLQLQVTSGIKWLLHDNGERIWLPITIKQKSWALSWLDYDRTNPSDQENTLVLIGASLVAQMVKNLPAMQETWVWSWCQEDPLEKGMATHSGILWEDSTESGALHGITELDTTWQHCHFLSPEPITCGVQVGSLPRRNSCYML